MKKESLGEKSARWRRTKSVRIGVILFLLLILAILYFVGGKFKVFILGLAILLLAALGMEVYDYDLDLGKLWETGSLQESRVQHTEKGIRLIGDCVSVDLNCADFQTQPEAQAKYEQCAQEVAQYNDKSPEELKNLDVYGLDRDKDGKVCEALPKGS
jgi:hypothetical protein